MTICVGNEAQDDNLCGNDMESVMAEIGVALIGFGLAGQVFHAPFVSAVPGLRLEAIVQRKGDAAAKAYPSARILRSVEEALKDPATGKAMTQGRMEISPLGLDDFAAYVKTETGWWTKSIKEAGIEPE